MIHLIDLEIGLEIGPFIARIYLIAYLQTRIHKRIILIKLIRSFENKYYLHLKYGLNIFFFLSMLSQV